MPAAAKANNGWFKPWMPWVASLVILAGSLAVLWGQTLDRVQNNCDRLDALEQKMDGMADDVTEIRQDTAYMRGFMETHFSQ